jgi:hypothetical protein
MDENKTFTPPDFGVTVLGCVNLIYKYSLMDLIQKVLLQVIFSG